MYEQGCQGGVDMMTGQLLNSNDKNTRGMDRSVSREHIYIYTMDGIEY